VPDEEEWENIREDVVEACESMGKPLRVFVHRNSAVSDLFIFPHPVFLFSS
jgi:hypothetical protein